MSLEGEPEKVIVSRGQRRERGALLPNGKTESVDIGFSQEEHLGRELPSSFFFERRRMMQRGEMDAARDSEQLGCRVMGRYGGG